VEAIYDDMTRQTGLARFAPVVDARGHRFSARTRSGGVEHPSVEPVITEAAYYGSTSDT
jgi:hypothetical protein